MSVLTSAETDLQLSIRWDLWGLQQKLQIVRMRQSRHKAARRGQCGAPLPQMPVCIPGEQAAVRALRARIERLRPAMRSQGVSRGGSDVKTRGALSTVGPA